MKRTLAATLLLAASALTHAEVQIHHGYLRASAPGAANSAGFMVIYNDSAKAVTLTGAKSPVAKAIELHHHINENSVMKMRRIGQIELPAGAHAELKPGGLHLMLMGLEAPLTAGQEASVTLQFSDGTEKQLTLPIRRQAPTPQHGSDHRHRHEQHGHAGDDASGHHH